LQIIFSLGKSVGKATVVVEGAEEVLVEVLKVDDDAAEVMELVLGSADEVGGAAEVDATVEVVSAMELEGSIEVGVGLADELGAGLGLIVEVGDEQSPACLFWLAAIWLQ
jgi:acyl-CoA hydrolase